MNNKLQEIKNHVNKLMRFEDAPDDALYLFSKGYINWLIKRVEELELEVNDWRAEIQKWQKFYKESEESHLETKELLKNIVNQNKRLREVIIEAIAGIEAISPHEAKRTLKETSNNG